METNIQEIQNKDRVDVILANPPFGGSERTEIQENFPVRTSETAYLFLQHFIKILRKGGSCGVVIKNTFLSNTDNASINLRKQLLEECNLHSILELPQGAFTGTGVKTVVLFFDKGTATHLAKVPQITPDIIAMAGPANAAYASGGMVTKLEAARIATSAGCQMVICNGKNLAPLTRLRAGAKHTLFTATHSPHTARKKWIAGSLSPKGKIRIDDGAATALQEGRSLLPAGMIEVTGQFDRGDLIEVEKKAGTVIGHGLSSYSSDEAILICGHKSNEIETILGYRGRDEMIHADDLVINDTLSQYRHDR